MNFIAQQIPLWLAVTSSKKEQHKDDRCVSPKIVKANKDSYLPPSSDNNNTIGEKQTKGKLTELNPADAAAAAYVGTFYGPLQHFCSNCRLEVVFFLCLLFFFFGGRIMYFCRYIYCPLSVNVCAWFHCLQCSFYDKILRVFRWWPFRWYFTCWKLCGF